MMQELDQRNRKLIEVEMEKEMKNPLGDVQRYSLPWELINRGRVRYYSQYSVQSTGHRVRYMPASDRPGADRQRKRGQGRP